MLWWSGMQEGVVEGQEVPALPRRTNTHSPPNAPSLLETVPFLNIFIGSLLSSGYTYGSHQGPQASLVSHSHLPRHSFPFPWRKGGKRIQQQRAGGQASDVTFRRPSCRGQEEFLGTSSCLWLSPAPEIPERIQQSPKNLKLYVKWFLGKQHRYHKSCNWMEGAKIPA